MRELCSPHRRSRITLRSIRATLPVEPVRPIPLRGIVRLVAPLMVAVRRFGDARKQGA